MRIAMACSVVLGALALLPWDAAAQFAEKKVLSLPFRLKTDHGTFTEFIRGRSY